MAFNRGKYGVEFDLARRREDASSGIGWVIALVAVTAAVSLAWTLGKRFFAASEEESGEAPGPVVLAVADEPSAPVSAPEVPQKPSEPPPAPPPEPPAETPKVVEEAVKEAAQDRRPKELRALLLRLEEAERRRDVEMAVSTIEAIRSLPGSPAADLDDVLARRLGDLNLFRLFERKSAKWVTEVTVARGQNASRIAHEHGSTFASLAKLNGGKEKVDRIRVGQKLKVMEHPKFVLVIRRRSRTADLTLGGRFFRRYDVKGEVRGKNGAYEVPARFKNLLNETGVDFSAEDRRELELLMPQGASVLVSEM